ncbi:MAG: putative molybdenum carrier protein [Desulfobacteraceae bacterium]|nr:putative molybdenum carrier protein [Desulfobacteraceae bacterium]
MLQKIISGGQTGADQAALDSAIKFNIEHGGWVPKGRKTEQGILSAKYKMDEMKTADYPARTRQNIIDSDATLIIAGSNPTGGTLLTKNLAKEMDRPYCHIDFVSMDDFEAAMIVHSFIVDNNIEILNVAGPRKSSDAAVYAGVRTIIEAMIYMIELASDEGIGKVEFDFSNEEKMIIPETMESAVKMLVSRLTLKTKVEIASLNNDRIASLYYELSDYIMDRFVIKPENTSLFDKYISEKSNTPYDLNDDSNNNTFDFFEPGFIIEAGDFVMTIIKELKKFLEKEYLLRVVK